MDLSDIQQNFDHLNMIVNLNSPSSGFNVSSNNGNIVGIGVVGIGGGGGSGVGAISGNAFNSIGVGGGGGGCCGGIISGVVNNESFQPTQQLVSANSFELNVATSLSDDSGVPLTNSSISSGDSYRLGLCKLELELVESDGEVSQFDSLEGSSDGGMSAENFNTLKKGPLAPIDPPPEFQDSPQTTMLRSKLIQNYAVNLSEHVIITALSDWLPPPKIEYNPDEEEDDEELKKLHYERLQKQRNDEYILASSNNYNNRMRRQFKNHIDINNHYNRHIYASDSLLNKCYNIYDDPDDNLTSSYENNLDIMFANRYQYQYRYRHHQQKYEQQQRKKMQKRYEYEDDDDDEHVEECKSCSPDLTLNKINKPTPKYPCLKYQSDSSSPQHRTTEIYDYNFYYALRKNHQRDNCYQHRRTPSSVLYSPIHNSHRHHYHHYHHHHHHHVNGNNNIPNLNRPNSRNSLNSRLSSSHNSLTVPNANKADDSIFITQAMSHDALLSREISDFYNVPIGADIYSFPIDMIRPEKNKDYYNNKQQRENGKSSKSSSGGGGRYKNTRTNKKRRRSNNTHEATGIEKYGSKIRNQTTTKSQHKRHSVPENTITPFQMTLDEVKKFYHSLYSSTSGSNETLSHINNINNNNNNISNINNNKNGHIKTIGTSTKDDFTQNNSGNTIITGTSTTTINNINSTAIINQQTTKTVNLKNITNDKSSSKYNYNNNNKSHINYKDEAIRNSSNIANNNNANNKFSSNHHSSSEKKSQFFINLNLKQKFCSIFRFRKNNDNRRNTSIFEPPDYINNHNSNRSSSIAIVRDDNKFSSRALPPLPNKNSLQKTGSKNNTSNNKKDEKKSEFNSAIHFASNIEKVKDYGWYWGPISSEAAEKILSNEPDGSFIVRDSSDDHYIFSLSFKLNNCVRHVRIEQDQGTFSFGSYAKFKSQTITEFIEKAVEHSRSGRYLFFLHRRPEHGPMRVQLTNPVSRFKHIQSLQHMCRFVILKAVVRKDLIPNLPLPRRLIDYLSYKHCYSEQIECDSSSQSQSSGDGVV